MTTRRKIALVLYFLVALFSFGLGLTYGLRDQFQSYHETAVGVPWDQLDSRLQTLLLALMEVAAGGWLALFVLTMALLFGPFRRGEHWARVIIPLGILTLYIPTLLATLRVLTNTPAVPPWYGAAAACAAAVIGFYLDRPWSRSPDRPFPTRQDIVGLVVILLVAVAAFIGTGLLADRIEFYQNRVYATELPRLSPEALLLHRSLFIVDLHGDTMLWDRDLLKRSTHGHVDLPRLKDGNVALQIFAAVTKTPDKHAAPPGAKLTEGETECLSADSRNMTGWLQVAQLRPLSVWFDLKKRALYQANRLRTFVKASNGDLQIIETVEDLRQLVQAQVSGTSRPIGALIALEGAHWLGEGNDTPEDVKLGVRELFDAGFRMLAPVHRFNNALGASSEGCDQRAGFTENGRAFLQAVGDSNIILDLAHASDAGIAEAAKASTGPVVVSHTGLRAYCRPSKPGEKPACDIARNMPDDEVRAVARTGGIVGVGVWIEAVGESMNGVVDAFAAAYGALSEPAFVDEMRARNPDYDPFDHIALGSDFDGAVQTPIDVAGLPFLVQALMDRRQPDGTRLFDDNAIRKIFGVNACRVFATRLPGGDAAKAKDICAPLMHGIAVRSTIAPEGRT
ncbi:MAG: membrane dipeptidase [Methyloceanibacter sp.]